MLYSTKKALNLNDTIYSRISDYDIYRKYIPNFKLGELICSPLRDDDKTPSFGTYKSNNSIKFKDFGTKETGNSIEFVKKLFKLNTIYEVLDKLREDFTNYKPSNFRYENRSRIISIVRQPFTHQDLVFWQSYNIKETTLNKFNVFSIKHYIYDGELRASYTTLNPMYAYKVYNKFKIYRPYSDKLYKWRMNLSAYDIQGYEQLPEKGNLLIITKSLKDVMVLYEMGYNAIAPPSESTAIPDVVIDDIKSRFDHIIVLYDRDSAGINGARKLIKSYNFDFIFINKKYKSKDISDMAKNLSFKTAKSFIENEINKRRIRSSCKKIQSTI